MKKFLIIIRDRVSDVDKASTKDFEDLVAQHVEWSNNLVKNKTFIAGDGLTNIGSLISKKGSEIEKGIYQFNGEVVGGYYLIQAANFNMAIEIATSCPTLYDNGSLEVRQIMDY